MSADPAALDAVAKAATDLAKTMLDEKKAKAARQKSERETKKATAAASRASLLPEQRPLSPAESAEVRAWLVSPDLLERLLEAVMKPDAKEGYLIGEHENAGQLVLECIERTSVRVEGESGGGKNTLVDAVTDILPEGRVKKVTAVTSKALRWLPETNSWSVLYIAELGGLSSGEESSSEYDMKLNISEGELCLMYPEKNEDGVMETRERHIRVEQFIVTTTSLGGSPELLNRMSILRVDDGETQTARVINAQLAKKAQRAFTDYASKVNVARGVMKVVLEETKDIDVLIPFAVSLHEVVPNDRTSNRREVMKLCRLISASAKLHHKMRPTVKTDGKLQIVASVDDLWNVLQFAGSNLRQTLGTVTDKEKEFLDIARGVTVCTIPEISKAARQQHRSAFYSQRTLRELADSLKEKGIFLAQTDEDGKEKKGYHGAIIYGIVKDAEGGATFDVERTILNAWDAVKVCEYVSPPAYLGAIVSESELTAIGGGSAIVTAPPPTTVNSHPESIAAKEGERDIPTTEKSVSEKAVESSNPSNPSKEGLTPLGAFQGSIDEIDQIDESTTQSERMFGA